MLLGVELLSLFLENLPAVGLVLLEGLLVKLSAAPLLTGVEFFPLLGVLVGEDHLSGGLGDSVVYILDLGSFEVGVHLPAVDVLLAVFGRLPVPRGPLGRVGGSLRLRALGCLFLGGLLGWLLGASRLRRGGRFLLFLGSFGLEVLAVGPCVLLLVLVGG